MRIIGSHALIFIAFSITRILLNNAMPQLKPFYLLVILALLSGAAPAAVMVTPPQTKEVYSEEARNREQSATLSPPGQDDAPTGNGVALAAFICGFVGLFVAGVLLGSVAVVLGVIGLNRVKRERRRLKGLAVLGILLGVVAIVGALVVIASMT